ncbi:serine/arginine repetitive matrix protein 1-like [Eleutherodactylus coqui]|uniref:serine/arginine repetitive matrix protein 1-like n=1 Tax=Eleutherodactylus coqui TaxID=57060 RepID=UPI0034623A97
MEIEAALEQLRTAAGIRGLQWLRRRMEAVLESAGAAIVPLVGHERRTSPERLSPEELHPTRQQLKSPPRGDAAILPLVSQEQRSPPERLGPEEPPPTRQRTESPSGDDAAIVSLASQERRSAPERLSPEEPPPTRQQLKSPPRGDAAILPLVSQEQRSPPERLSPEEPPPTQQRQKIASKIVAVIAPPVSLKRRSPPERLSSKEAPPTRKRRESPSKADAAIVPSASRERRSLKRLSSKEASRSRSRRESPSKADAAIVPSVNRERRSPKRLSSKETSRSRSRRESPSKADAAIVPSVNRERRSPKRLSSKEASRSRSGRESRSREPPSRVTHSSRESRSRRSPTRCKDSAEGGRPRSEEKARSRTRQASDGEQDTAGSSASDVPVEELPCQPSEKSEAEKACGPTDDQINSQRVSGGGQQSAGPEAQGRSSSPRTEVTASDTAASSQTVQMLGGSPVMEVEAVVTSQCDHQDPETTASVVTAPMPSGRRPALVWIFGHSYVHRSADAAKNYPTGRQLGISQDYATVRWIGTRGMLWREVLPEVHRFARLDRPPDILVLDVGGNDLGIRPFRELTRDIRYDILRLLSSFPGLIIVFSELTIRKTWHNARSADGINKARIKINRVISPFVDQNGGVAVRHRDLEKGQGDYWLDNGIDLNAAGINIWALAIKEGIEKALLLWRASQA